MTQHRAPDMQQNTPAQWPCHGRARPAPRAGVAAGKIGMHGPAAGRARRPAHGGGRQQPNAKSTRAQTAKNKKHLGKRPSGYGGGECSGADRAARAGAMDASTRAHARRAAREGGARPHPLTRWATCWFAAQQRRWRTKEKEKDKKKGEAGGMRRGQRKKKKEKRKGK